MSIPYVPPVRDLAFALEVLGVDRRETLTDLLAEFGRFCAEVIAPLDQPGDRAGVQLDPATGAVTTAPGWKDAYARYVEAGWNSVSSDPAFGGGGFPGVLTTAMQEELNAASMAFALCPMLTQGAVHMISRHGTADQQARWLPNLITGAWTGTMNLTEAGAGSDVGALTARAEPLGDGTWRIRGQKIFITYGEHDLAEQIVHLVLARVPDAPPGTRGISCFIVPKVLPDGSPNGVRCIGIEHKMGIHASPTCTLEYDGAVGELVGTPNEGMRHMFTMMNNARLSVGVEGVGVAVRAYQDAVGHAKERVQGRVAGSPDRTIIGHADVRRMVLQMRAHIEAMRLLALRNSTAIDDGDEPLADLLTPLTKAWCTDTGAEVARLATQVVGGMGYIRETGVEQHERDVRIAAIYEGTNGIQAIDLVGRKLIADDGAAMRRAVDDVMATADALGDASGDALRHGARTLTEASDWLRTAWAKDPRQALAGATPYLRLAATVVSGGLLGRQALVAAGGAATDPFLAAKVTTARLFLEQAVPSATGLLPSITAGAEVLDAIPTALL